MLQKIERKQRNAKIVLFAGIILTALFAIVVVCRIALDSAFNLPIPIALSMGFAVYLGPILLIAYFVNYYPFEKCMKMLESNGHSLEYCLLGIENAPKMPQSKIICTENSLIFEKQKWVIPYQSILWIYKQVVKGAYGLVTVEVNMMIATETGSKFKVKNVKDDELMWLLHNFSNRFPKDFILGFGSEQSKKYKEITKHNRKKS